METRNKNGDPYPENIVLVTDWDIKTHENREPFLSVQSHSSKYDDASWYSSIPCGKNYLSKMVSEMFTEAGVEERETNHSLRAAGVSRLYETGVDDKVIQSRPGH